MLKYCNDTLEIEPIHEIRLAKGGPAWVTFHNVALMISAGFTFCTIIISLVLIGLHVTQYRYRREQRYIIRLILMMPVYSVTSGFSLFFYQHALYWQLAQNFWEAIAIHAFFSLLCNYIEPDPAKLARFWANYPNSHSEQSDFDRSDYEQSDPRLGEWMWPLSWPLPMRKQGRLGMKMRGCVHVPRRGTAWFLIIRVLVYQYCFFRPTLTIASIIAQHFGKYCANSYSPMFANVYIFSFLSTSVGLAMIGLLQFYFQVRHFSKVAIHKPTAKILCIKLVVFLQFWQGIIISGFIRFKLGPFKPSDKVAYIDLSLGIPVVLSCVELAIFAGVHCFFFKSKHYTEYELKQRGREPDTQRCTDQDPGYDDAGWFRCKLFTIRRAYYERFYCRRSRIVRAGLDTFNWLEVLTNMCLTFGDLLTGKCGPKDPRDRRVSLYPEKGIDAGGGMSTAEMSFGPVTDLPRTTSVQPSISDLDTVVDDFSKEALSDSHDGTSAYDSNGQGSFPTSSNNSFSSRTNTLVPDPDPSFRSATQGSFSSTTSTVVASTEQPLWEGTPSNSSLSYGANNIVNESAISYRTSSRIPSSFSTGAAGDSPEGSRQIKKRISSLSRPSTAVVSPKNSPRTFEGTSGSFGASSLEVSVQNSQNRQLPRELTSTPSDEKISSISSGITSSLNTDHRSAQNFAGKSPTGSKHGTLSSPNYNRKMWALMTAPIA